MTCHSESAGAIVVDRLPDLRFGVHDERAVFGDRLLERLARDEDRARGRLAGAQGRAVATAFDRHTTALSAAQAALAAAEDEWLELEKPREEIEGA